MPVIDTKEIKDFNQIGKGGFGKVYQGEWGHIDVAIKKVKLKNRKSEIDFLEEMRILARVRHSNIVQLYAVNSDHYEANLVMELCEGKALHFVIHDKDTKMQYNLDVDKKNNISK